jgi:hypothetical protein
MGKVFNTTGACNPKLHYTVDISGRLQEIKKLVDNGAYFTINRARQYGKTTTLTALQEYLKDEYMVIYMDFQFLSNASFESEESFVRAFSREFVIAGNDYIKGEIKDELKNLAKNKNLDSDLGELFIILSDLCRQNEKPIVLIIDEVDSASNNQVFLDFLAQLRGYYIHRANRPIFQSVILAGVHDVKNIKRKIRPDDDSKNNSPWNIATDFDISMSFSEHDIAGMIAEYDADKSIGMDINYISKTIYEYTHGYPYLVSRICKIIDEKIVNTNGINDLKSAWTREGIVEAVKLLISEKNTLFESLINKLVDYPEIRQITYDILFNGSDISYNSLNKAIEIAEMFGFVRNENNKVIISNRIFETILYNYFLSEEIVGNQMYKSGLENKNQFIKDGHLNMKHVLEKFVETFDYIYGDESEKFVEEVGRKYFMLFLKPIINGVGNCYVESRTRNMKRTDIIVDYKSEQFIIELKIWKGDKYNSDGEKQIAEYIEFYHLKKGYMLTFNFNQNKQIGVNEVMYGDIVIVEAVV